MNKAQLIDAVAKETELKKKDAEAAVNAIMGIIEKSLVDGEKVQLVGFGTFEVKDRAERIGKNPRTGEAIKIAASKYPTFTAGSAMKAAVNK